MIRLKLIGNSFRRMLLLLLRCRVIAFRESKFYSQGNVAGTVNGSIKNSVSLQQEYRFFFKWWNEQQCQRSCEDRNFESICSF